jgi:ubiquinone/menaquinone biosynthesis C-methylase UbiE
MPDYIKEPVKFLDSQGFKIASFIAGFEGNTDKATVESFGEEWSKFGFFSDEEIRLAGDQYFDIVDERILNKNSTVLDLGCGSGRWSKYAAEKAGFIEAIDPSDAVFSAARLNSNTPNVRVTQAGVDQIPFADHTFDFIICLGVLHHIPDTGGALKKAVMKLKPGGHILLYLYYNLENRGVVFKSLFAISDLFRRIISGLPPKMKMIVCDIIAFSVYLPFIGLSAVIRAISPGKNWFKKIPLSYYIDKSWRIIRNDSLDRFGTPLEQRFSKAQMEKMMLDSGLEDIRFSDYEPYLHATGRKK